MGENVRWRNFSKTDICPQHFCPQGNEKKEKNMGVWGV